jgi:hypothetical protein
VGGVRCRYLEENTVADRRWVCGLRRVLGSWEAVHADPGYIENVQRFWDAHPNITSCGEWQPEPGVCCRET